ncbi:MAG TPA: hypothetical protein VKE88_02350 [Candidatus Nanoarchaeia archaeon]|nr:hypothetical protein [Candidatus Nanoarchaeia archaeon]
MGARMFGKKRDDIATLKQYDVTIRAAFKAVKDEMDDHLASINENTDEMQAFAAHLDDLDIKFEKLNEKLDEMRILLSKTVSQNNGFSLSDSEKSVFMVLYAVEQTPLSYGDIAMRTGLTELAVKAHIFSMINKGIPILERDIDGSSYFRLDKKFKELQAKDNVLKIDMDEFN